MKGSFVLLAPTTYQVPRWVVSLASNLKSPKEVGASWSGFGVTASSNFMTNSQKTQASTFKSHTEEQSTYTIGAKPPDDDKASTWIQSIIENPAPITLRLTQLDTLFESYPGLVSDTVLANLNKYL